MHCELGLFPSQRIVIGCSTKKSGALAAALLGIWIRAVPSTVEISRDSGDSLKRANVETNISGDLLHIASNAGANILGLTLLEAGLAEISVKIAPFSLIT